MSKQPQHEKCAQCTARHCESWHVDPEYRIKAGRGEMATPAGWEIITWKKINRGALKARFSILSPYGWLIKECSYFINSRRRYVRPPYQRYNDSGVKWMEYYLMIPRKRLWERTHKEMLEAVDKLLECQKIDKQLNLLK